MSDNVILLTAEAFYDPRYSDIKFTMIGNNTDILDEIEKRGNCIVRRLKLQKVTPELINRVSLLFPNLEELDISNNKLERIPSGVFTLQKLTRLNIRATKISEVPRQIYKLKNLDILDLSFNQISTIQKGIFDENQQMRSLDISGNKITSIGYNSLQNLLVLIASLNYIERLNIIAPSLLELDINNNCIMDLLWLQNFKHLTSLNVSSQRLKEDVLHIETLPKMECLDYLNIAGNDLIITDEIQRLIIGRLPMLAKIDISFNDILSLGILKKINIINDTSTYNGII